MTSNYDDQIRTEYATLLDNFTNLLKAAKVQDPALREQGSIPGEMLEVFAEKMLAALRALLAITSELKRNALLNDIPSRNAEVHVARQNFLEQEAGKREKDLMAAVDVDKKDGQAPTAMEEDRIENSDGSII